jgi:hypothetical protein
MHMEANAQPRKARAQVVAGALCVLFHAGGCLARGRSRHHWNEDPVYGYQTGTKHPVPRAKQNQLQPIGLQ